MMVRILRGIAALLVFVTSVVILTNLAWIGEATGSASSGDLRALGLGSFIASSILLLGNAVQRVLRSRLEATRMEYWVTDRAGIREHSEWEAAGLIDLAPGELVAAGEGAGPQQSWEARNFQWVDAIPAFESVERGAT